MFKSDVHELQLRENSVASDQGQPEWPVGSGCRVARQSVLTFL